MLKRNAFAARLRICPKHPTLLLSGSLISDRKSRAGEPPVTRLASVVQLSWQVSAAFEGYIAALPFPQPFFPPAPSSSSRLALCPPTRCRSVSAMQATAPLRPLESPGRAPSPSATRTGCPTHYWSSRTPAVATTTLRSRSNTLPIVKMPHQQPCLNLRPANLRYRAYPAV